jgi:TPR repeat protein
LRQAAEAELPTAIYLLAVLTEQGVGVTRDPAVAARLYGHAAERGQRSAQLRWGLALMEGRDVVQDLVLGESWLRRRATGGALAAPRRRGGAGGPIHVRPDAVRRARRDPGSGSGTRLGRPRAAAGLREAQVALAGMLVNGRGGPRDTAAALELIEKAAVEGHSGAMFALGALHADGHDLPEDRTAAQRWFRAAAELGRGQAQLMLGRYLAEGVAGEPNPSEARSWFEQAAAQGIEEAQADLAARPGLTLQ